MVLNVLLHLLHSSAGLVFIFAGHQHYFSCDCVIGEVSVVISSASVQHTRLERLALPYRLLIADQ
jgi:hypothetical protein